MPESLLDRLNHWDKLARMVFLEIKSTDDLARFYQTYLGKKSELNTFLKSLKDLSSEAKKEIGPKIQKTKQALELDFLSKKEDLETEAINQKLQKDWIDVTKQKTSKKGALHPISRVQREIESIFTSMGFEVCDGPLVETEYNNFDALNIPETHPARDMQDTFFINTGNQNSKENSVLRTHTSPVQHRRMIQGGAPIRMICPGRTFRNEDVDSTHDAMFYQFEGLMIDQNISLANLKGVIEHFFSAFFKKDIKVRIRPGYFPFVEPGLEVDMWFEIPGKEPKWLEMVGAGMVHPKVLEHGKIDTEKYSGFAFGFGLTRLAMIKYEIDDIRLLSSGKKEFLQQF